MSNPILLIHGLWMTPRSWEQFVERYTTQGTRCTRRHGPGWKVTSRRCGPTPHRWRA